MGHEPRLWRIIVSGKVNNLITKNLVDNLYIRGYKFFNQVTHYFPIIIALSLFLNPLIEQKQKESNLFDLNGQSTLVVKNNASDSMHIALENWYLIPWKSQEVDTTLQPGDSISLILKTQANSYFTVKINKQPLKLFSKPNNTNYLTYSGINEKYQFAGDLRGINEFIYQKSTDFGSIDADWLPRVNFTHGNGSFNALIKANDSITSLHQNYLHEHRQELPNWYFEFESNRLLYLNAHWKLNSLMYRKRMTNITDSVPDGFLASTIGALPINDPKMIGNIRYTNFLSDYIGYISDPNYQNEKPASKEEWVKFYEQVIYYINQELKGEVRDYYLTFFLGNIIERRSYLFNEEWTLNIGDEKLRQYVDNKVLLNPILPPGSKMPYFYLSDSTNSAYEQSTFKGKVVLINFWATWCKPCIQEFPFENLLVEKYENSPVEIVNICIDSKIDTWKKYIIKHKLKTTNLFATENWSENLQKSYGIQALPHSVLVDWNGIVVKNKCPAASENIDNLINELLSEMIMENN